MTEVSKTFSGSSILSSPALFKSEYRLKPLILQVTWDLDGISLKTVKMEVTPEVMKTPFGVFFLYPIFFRNLLSSDCVKYKYSGGMYMLKGPCKVIAHIIFRWRGIPTTRCILA